MKMKTKGAIKSKEEEEKRGGAALRYRHWMDFAQEKIMKTKGAINFRPRKKKA
jgi:hypothetical protein